MAEIKKRCPECGEEFTGADETMVDEELMAHLQEAHGVDVVAEQMEGMMKQQGPDDADAEELEEAADDMPRT